MLNKILSLLGYEVLSKEDNEFFEETANILGWIEESDRVHPYTLESAADEFAECANGMSDAYNIFDPAMFRYNAARAAARLAILYKLADDLKFHEQVAKSLRVGD